MRTVAVWTGVVSLSFLMGSTGAAPHADLPGPRLACHRADDAPAIDGKLDDVCWRRGIAAGPFFMVGESRTAYEPTRARVAWDDRCLYVAFQCHERCLDPVLNQLDKFVAAKTERDSAVWADDSVEIFIASHQSDAGYYHIAVNSLGTVFDGAGFDRPKAWDAPIRAAGQVGKGVWSAEVAIPLDSLCEEPPSVGDVWRINLCRAEKAQQEFSSWAPVARKGFHSPDRFGYLVFAETVPTVLKVDWADVSPGANRARAVVAAPADGPAAVTFRLATRFEGEAWHRCTVGKSLAADYTVDPENRALSLEAVNTGTRSTHSARFAVRPDVDYELSALVKSDGQKADRESFRLLYVCSYDANGKMLDRYTPLGRVRGKASNWQHVRATWHAPATAANAMLWAVAWKGHGTGAFLIDDLHLREADSGKDVLPNGTFPAGNELRDWVKVHAQIADGRGAGCRSFESSYQILDGDRVVYQSPVGRWAMEQANYPIRSRFCYLANDGKAVSMWDLTHLHIAAGTVERLPLVLQSAMREQVKEVELQLDLPQACRLVSPVRRERYCPSPVSCDEELATDSGQAWRRYRLRFGPDAISGQDSQPHEIIPIPLLVEATHDPAGKDALAIRHRALIVAGESEPKAHALPLTILPPLSGKRPRALPLIAWPTDNWNFAQLSAAERQLLLSKWAQAGFNHMTGTRHKRYDAERRRVGFTLLTLLPTLHYTWHFPHRSYTDRHPEFADRSAKGKRTGRVCLAHLLDRDCPFWDIVCERFERHLTDYPRHVNWDYEFDPLTYGFSERNIELFRKRKGLAADVQLTPDTLLGEHLEAWLDFRCWQNGQFFGRYREIVKERQPNCLFSAYSGYQSPHAAEHYGIDWKYVAPHVDLVMCGYGRGTFEETRQAAGDTQMNGGELVWGGYYDLDSLECTIFQRLTDSGSFMTYGAFIQDGRFFTAVSRAAAVATDFEPFFRQLRRQNELVRGYDGAPCPDIVMLTHGGDRLVLVFNGTNRPKTRRFENVSLPAGFVAIDHDTKKVLQQAARIETTVAPFRVKTLYLTAADSNTPDLAPPKPVEPTADSAFPILRWHDANAARHRYVIQLSATEDFVEPQISQEVASNIWQATDPLASGRTYRWRVKAIDVLRNTESDWSAVGAFTVPRPRAFLKANRDAEQELDSIDALGYWHAYWAFLFQTASRDRDVVREGSYSFRIDNPYDQSVGNVANWRGPWGTRLPRVRPGEKLRFTVWAKATAESVKPSAAIGFLDKNGKRIRGRTVERPGTGNWSPTCVEARAPDEARNAYLLFGAKGRGSAWLDDFAFERVDRAQ